MRRTALLLVMLIYCPLAANISRAQPSDNERFEPGRSDNRPTHPLAEVFDTDGDGIISAEEISGAAAKLQGLDASNDGQLDRQELPRLAPPGPPAARRQRGRRPAGPGRGRGGVSESDLESRPLAQDDTEKRILAALDEMRRGPRFANVSYTDGRLLRLLAEAVGAQRIVEIGTSTGESATWLALAVEATGGQVYTHEIDQGRADVAAANFKKAGVDKLITIVMGDAHETVSRYKDPNDELFVNLQQQEAIDVLFLDADKEGYIDYLQKLMPLVRPGGLIIAHNMNTRQADLRFVKAITEDPQLETLILLREGTGVGVTLKKR